MRRSILVAVVAFALLAALAWARFAGPCAPAPSAAEILAAIERPESPALAPDAAQASFRLAPGLRVELVAAEPLVVAPVAIDWDDAGRLYVVEMRGFMTDLAGSADAEPSGRVAVLEDLDGDGVMDTRHELMTGLVLPRAISVTPEGVLVGAPPDLWLCRPARDFRCASKRRVGDYGVGAKNPEHAENGLSYGIDGWLYNAKSTRRLRLGRGRLESQPTPFRGQWGIARDDVGRLFYDNNSQLAAGDLFAADYLLRHPATASLETHAGVNVDLSAGNEVHPVRVTPGVNRAYLDGTLRADGRLRAPTAAGGLTLYRGDQLGEAFAGDLFVPDPAGNLIAQISLREDAAELAAEHVTYDDPEWGQREFLASSDERFRPVQLGVGPDGALSVVDMYRGLIQHETFVSDYLGGYVKQHGLEAPSEMGRIWRVVREGGEARHGSVDASKASAAARVSLLSHPNGWQRDRAQRWLVHAGDRAALPLLRALGEQPALARVHALWTLALQGALDEASWRRALADADPRVRSAGLRSGEPLLRVPSAARIASAQALANDRDPGVRLQALLSLGEVPPAARPLESFLAAITSAPDDALVRIAVLSGSRGIERALLGRALEAPALAAESPAAAALLSDLAGATLLGAAADGEAAAFLDRVASLPDDWRRRALLGGIAQRGRAPGFERIALAAPHALFADAALAASDASAPQLRSARRAITWPGDSWVPGSVPLTAQQEARRAAGEALYASTCAACHGRGGAGLPGLAPRLAGSAYVTDAEDWLLRIALDGIAGPLTVAGEDWNLAMPGFRADPRLSDEALAGLATHLRRGFGNLADPVEPETVARIRAETSARAKPWAAAELAALDVPHRLDRYVGRYKIDAVPMALVVEREGAALRMGILGMGEGPLREEGTDSFSANDPQRGELRLDFVEGASGRIAEVVMLRPAGDRIAWRRVE